MELLKMNGIAKSFYGVSVLDDVSLELNKGEVHALLGENGAGKSTLMNILAGVHSKDRGTIAIDGKEVTHHNIKAAEHSGIAFVHQELNLLNDLKVYENVFLGRELVNRAGCLRKKEMIRQTRELMASLGIGIDPSELVGNLDAGRKQLLEIAKTLHADAKLFILDEPTTALNNEEIDRLFEIVNRLKQAGRSFIFISHKMPEIFRIADRYTILRNGRLVKSGDIRSTTPEEIARHMVGEEFSGEGWRGAREIGEPVLELRRLSGIGFKSIDLSVRKGEIIGFTGLQGAGCSEVLQTIFGVLKPHGGQILFYGKSPKNHTIQSAMRDKVAMVPANRKENSVIPDLTLLENTYISKHAIHSWPQHIAKSREIKKYEALKTALNIKANSHREYIATLSGGNQQKIILARWLNTEADMILFDNPTQGIDVGAKSEIYKLILNLSHEGKTIIVHSLEIPEIQQIADRCVVFYHGRIAAILDRQEITEETVMLYATNAWNLKAEGAEEDND